MRKPKSDYAIQTVGNALRLLEEFREEAEIGVTELSRRLALHKNNVFRLLATLEQQGYIEQSLEDGRYRLGLRAFELGQAFARSRNLLGCARPVLRRLVDELGETVHLGSLDGHEVIHLDGVSSPRLVQTELRVGLRLPIHCTALGKVLLGCSPESVRKEFDRAVAAGRQLPSHTARTIRDPDKFFEHIRTVAGQGFAVDLGECDEGLECAAAPVHDAAGAVVAALSVSVPRYRVEETALLSDFVPAVTRAADQLSRALGHSA